MRMFGKCCTSPSYSLSTFAMMRSTVDLPEPFRPSRPIFAPGKKLSEMSLMIWRLGGTILLTRSIDITYWAMVVLLCGFGKGVAYRKALIIRNARLERGHQNGPLQCRCAD